MKKLILLIGLLSLMGCSDVNQSKLFVAVAKECGVGSKQTITYRVGTWSDYLETKCEFVVTEKKDD